jgi:hypothetical protein
MMLRMLMKLMGGQKTEEATKTTPKPRMAKRGTKTWKTTKQTMLLGLQTMRMKKKQRKGEVEVGRWSDAEMMPAALTTHPHHHHHHHPQQHLLLLLLLLLLLPLPLLRPG